jgi:hypothetical protein
MTTFPASASDIRPADHVVLQAATAAYLGRYRGAFRLHTGSDLKIFLAWCAGQDLDPLAAARADVERYIRWLQDVRRYQPSTVSRRLSDVVGFYRVCVIDQILPNSPADYVPPGRIWPHRARWCVDMAASQGELVDAEHFPACPQSSRNVRSS